jgi:hypothetical protein
MTDRDKFLYMCSCFLTLMDGGDPPEGAFDLMKAEGVIDENDEQIYDDETDLKTIGRKI